jgi:hypothetical protein
LTGSRSARLPCSDSARVAGCPLPSGSQLIAEGHLHSPALKRCPHPAISAQIGSLRESRAVVRRRLSQATETLAFRRPYCDADRSRSPSLSTIPENGAVLEHVMSKATAGV